MITLTLLRANRKGAPSEKLEKFPAEIEGGDVLWVDAESPTEEEMGSLKARFNLDDYSVEDVLHKNQRPKVEDYGKNVFSVVHIPFVRNRKIFTEELFVFFQKSWFITVHSNERELIRAVDARVRTRGLEPLTDTPSTDLLFYVFLDFAVDEYFQILDNMEDQLEDLDKEVVSTFKSRSNRGENVSRIMSTVGEVRKQLMGLRRSLAPTRDMVGMIMRGSVPFIQDSSLRSFRDIYDHSFQLLETIDNYRDRTTDVRDLYLGLVTASTDNIIKVLTLVATIFLPLSLLAGVYGMNFTAGFFEPGSGSPAGFYTLVAAMMVISLALLISFKRTGWI